MLLMRYFQAIQPIEQLPFYLVQVFYFLIIEKNIVASSSQLFLAVFEGGVLDHKK